MESCVAMRLKAYIDDTRPIIQSQTISITFYQLQCGTFICMNDYVLHHCMKKTFNIYIQFDKNWNNLPLFWLINIQLKLF